LCFDSVFVYSNDFDDHGSHPGDMAQALAQWRHPVASCEVLDVLHWVMHPTSYRRIHMAIKIASSLPACYVVIDSLSLTNIAK
jgi:hypothetical protein